MTERNLHGMSKDAPPEQRVPGWMKGDGYSIFTSGV